MREREGVGDLGLDRRPGVERRRLGRADGVAIAVHVALPGDLLEAPVGLRAQRGAPGVGADAVDGRLHRDLEQRAALERLAERLADALDRLAQALALELELLEPALELARHLVELDAERGELVAALGRHLDAEVALRHLLRGLQQPLDLRLQRARDGEREGEGGDQRGDQDREHLERRAAEPAVVALGQQPHGDAAAVEGRAVEAGQAQRAAADLDLAARGQLLGAGVGQRRGDHPRAGGDDHLGAGHALDEQGVVLGGDDRDGEHAGAGALGVDQAGARGRDRLAATRLEAAGTLEDHERAHRALLGRERLEPRLDRPALAGLDRGGETPVLPDLPRGGLRAVLELTEQPGGGALGLEQPRVGLALLGVRRQHEPDRRDHDHREDDQDDEEDGEAVAKAHLGTGRPASLVAPRLQSASCGSCVSNDRPDPGL